ncbi:hypothetical protein AAC387_Pa11g1498 [Persea americana]
MLFLRKRLSLRRIPRILRLFQKGSLCPKQNGIKLRVQLSKFNALSVKDLDILLPSVPIGNKKSKGKALNVAWDEESNDDTSKPDSPTSESGKFVAFMALSNTSFVQESKSEDDLNINEFSDEE